MKRFTSFLCSLLLLSLAGTNLCAQDTKELALTFANGTCTSTGYSTTYCYSWTSTDTEPAVTISVSDNKNNLVVEPSSGGFEMHEGAGSTWNFTVNDYVIVSYSFTYKTKSSGNDVTITINGATYTSSDSEQNLEITGVNSSTTSFQLSGNNKGIIVTNLKLVVRKPLALTSLEVGQVYRFVNVLYPTYSLNANSATDVNAVTTNETDTKQQWYVEKQDGEYYVLRNLAYGKYLKGAGKSTDWSMSDDYSDNFNKFKLYTSNTDYNTLHTNTLANYAYIHCNSSHNIVGWSNGTTDKGSHWEITKVDYTAEDITALLEKAPTVAESAAYVTSLETLFADAACVTPALASLAAAQATDAYDALPATLKAMVDKVYREKTESVALETAWTEDNANADKASAGLNWNGEYAKKFRVQMYEPYSIAGDITGFLRMNAHANNDNPTGIYVPGGGTVYVMVEGNIKDGATLRLINGGSNNRITDATTGGYELKTGLNVINFAAEAGMLYICYNVDTYDPNGANEELKFPHKLSEYPPLKIHIEGGAINGFYSSCGDYLAGRSFGDDLSAENNLDLWGGVDDDNDWIYMEERANLSVLPIISHRQILLFQLNEENGQQGMKHFLPESVSVPETPFSYPQNGETSSWDDYDAYGMDCNITTGKINIWMETWDRIMHAELATLGLISEDDVNIMNKFYPRWTSDGSKAEIYDMTNAGPDGNTYKVFCNGRDYSEYYNHHGVSLGTTSGYMSAGWNAANYNNSTFGELMGMPTSGGLWGPVHEIGHQFQDVFNIRGATEVTNNVFSNAATWYQGISTSRYNGGNLTTTLDNFNSGLPFVDYNIWSMTQMFYKLWLYYHLAGNNTQFYPRFFEMLRVDPLNAKGATATGTESMLKIYEKMCDAAGEDLTEFFRAHGFFVLLDNYAKGDYGTTIFTQTQEEVDAAIARVKAKYTKENFAVILINDGAEATLRHDGKTPRSFFDDTANPEYGGVNDFINGSATTGGTYEAVVNNDGTVTMKGEGGIGFLVFDENGNLISFSDNPTFALSDEAKESIMTGNVTVVSIGSDINAEPVVAKIDLTAMQKNILGELIAKAKQIIDKIDNTYTKIGFYKGAAVADLAAALENAETVYEGTSGYEAAYDLLYAEYKKVEANTDAKITIDLNKKYIINNKSYSTCNIAVEETETGVYQVFALENSTGTAAQWSFVESSTAGSYYLKNADGYYCPAVVTGGTGGNATTDQSQAGTYKLIELEHGLWAIQGTSAPMHASSTQNFNIVGWTYESVASQWYIILTEADEEAASLSQLQADIAKTEALLGEVLGTVTYTRGENIALQTTTEGSAGYIWSNAPHSEGPIANLVDGATTNYFHTDWQSGSDVTSGDHYIAVDLGAGNTLPRFAFSHTTRSGVTNDFPKSVDVYGSDDNVTYKYLGSASDMPQSAGAFWQFNGMIISSHRYLRFNMHANRGYWHMAEFDIMPVTSYTATVNDTYSSTVTVATVQSAMEALYNGKGVAVSTSPTKADIDAKLEVLKDAYNALYTEYSATITARKNTLAQLAANTQNLINQVGTVEIIPTIEAKLQTTEPDGDFYVSTNAQSSQEGPIANLVDGNNNTFFHSDYSGSNSSDGLDHSINIKLGEAKATKLFEFSYVTRHNAETNYPTAMTVYGSTNGTDYEMITSFTGLPASQTATYGPVLIECSKEYTYLRFMVTENSSDTDKGGHPFFHMAEFDLTTIGSTTTTINSKYKSVVTEELLLASVHATNSSAAMSTNALVTSVPMLDAQIADQQAAYDRLNEAMQQATCDKTELQAAYDEALALYNKMADAEGNVTADYAPSTLTVEQLAAAKTALDAAKDKLDNSSDQDEIDAAKTAVDEQYAVLIAIEEANINREGSTFDKSELETLINDAEALLSTINGKTENNSDYYAAAGIAIDELQDAYDAAVDANDRYYLTQEQYATVKAALNNSYTTINPIVAADVTAREELTTLIANVNTLLVTIAEESAPKNVAVPLQSTAADKDFYVSVAGTSSGSVAYLYDKNADGSGITAGDSYYGSNWQGVTEFSQYVQVDLGAGITIDKLLFDYTTRDSGHATERPSAIKIYGSNNGTDYTEITEINSGLATGQREKWSMAETLELGARYRYIRFNVNSTSEYHSFHMSDFNLYAIIGHTLALKEYYTTAEGLELGALCIALQSAEYAAEHYLTSEQLGAVVSALEGYYTAANTIVEADVEDRTELGALATTTKDLVSVVATFNTNEEELVMQCTDETAPYYLYCNADNSTNENADENDKVGVAALVGDNATNTTHLHTTYGNNAQDDDLDHYLRLDMGENKAMMSFKFRYTGRDNNINNAPTKMIVEGSNDLENFDEIAKLEIAVPESGTATYETPEALGNGKAYRYIRFMVKETQNGANNNGHPFFVLSQFAVTACKTVEVNSEYESPNLPLSTLVTANNEAVDADAITAHYALTTDYDTALEELQAAYDALNTAKNFASIPVKLTTDVNNPVLYKIELKRNSNVFTYDGETAGGTKKPVLAANEEGNKYQAWYFMEGTNNGSTEDVLILPYYNEGAKNTTLRLGFASTDNNTDIIVVSEGTNTTDNWYIKDSNSDGYWCLQPEGGSANNAYVNQFGGSSGTRLAFWTSANNLGDIGSQFRFVLDETDYTLSDAYYALKAQYKAYGTPVAGTTVGAFTAESVETYNAKAVEVAAILEAKNSTDDEYNTAREGLIAAYNAITINLPSSDKFYVLRCNHENRYIYASTMNKIMWTPTAFDTANPDPSFVWIFEEGETAGTYKMKNLQTGDYLPTLSGSSITLVDAGVDVTLAKSRNVAGAIEFSTGGDNGLHAHGGAGTDSTDDDFVISYSNDAGANHYFFEEVEVDVKTEIKQTVTLTTDNSDVEKPSYSSLFLAYDALIPDGIIASIVMGLTADGQLKMVEVTGGVLPAETAVILKGTADGSVDFKYTETEPTFDTSANILKGTAYTKIVDCRTSSVYMLGRKNNRVAFYRAYENFNANGVKQTVNGTTNHNESGYVKCNANKSYLQIDDENVANSQAAAAMFSFFFGGNTTDIESINAVAEAYDAVYDLQGRKLEKVTEPGIYIVNGKKVYVSEVE